MVITVGQWSLPMVLFNTVQFDLAANVLETIETSRCERDPLWCYYVGWPAFTTAAT